MYSKEWYIENIDNLARIDINLIDMLEQSQKERFGEITKKESSPLWQGSAGVF